jgi:peptidoglycan/LPS O-acetylase OafA/YrhL
MYKSDVRPPLVLSLNFAPADWLSCFVLGCIASRIYMMLSNKSVTKLENFLGIFAIFTSIALIIAFIIYGDLVDPFLQHNYAAHFAFTPLFAIIIFSLARYNNFLSYLLSTRVFILLGEASYSFYLLHLLFLSMFFLAKPASMELQGIFYGIIVISLVIVTSLGSYKYIENPLRKIIGKGLFEKPKAEVTSVDREMVLLSSSVKE